MRCAMPLRASGRSFIAVMHAHAASCLGRGMLRLGIGFKALARCDRRAARMHSTPVTITPIQRISAETIRCNLATATRCCHDISDGCVVSMAYRRSD
ncbi:hypothetical protein EBA12_15130 [Xanthomonas oryzae pv. oryzae]|nr:hypothetical protein EBA10_14790 [Xanthomonas oryzae pv. oryzae]QBN69139.1 hypothetical protein EBA12_15130 [Xanthomonas oryzae pv. oryzae]